MIKAVGKRLVVKEIKEEEPEKKNVIITVSGKERFKAEVIAMGTEVDCYVSHRDIVILAAHTGNPFQHEGENYLTIFEDQILAVIGA